MSTKRLSRTVLEGGRYNRNKYERNYTHKEERAAFREYMSTCMKDVETAEEEVPPQRRKIYKGFTDKLAPVYRWLDKHVGKSWAKTYKILKQKFDDRTLAGFHIVHQHMLSSIGTEAEEKEVDYAQHYYYIDKNNILRKSDFNGWRKRSWRIGPAREPFSREQEEAMVQWLDKRLIGFVGGVLYWFQPTSENVILSWSSYSGISVSAWNFCSGSHCSFRQGSRCSKEDVNTFRQLPDWVRKKLLDKAPNAKEKEVA